MRILIVGASAANAYGESRHVRELLDRFKGAGHTVGHVALGHEFTNLSQDQHYDTYTTFKNHMRCCGLQAPVMEYMHGNEMAALMPNEESQMVPVETFNGCMHGSLMGEDLYAAQTFPWMVSAFRPDIVITIGDYNALLTASASFFRQSYNHIHYLITEGNGCPELFRAGAPENSIKTALRSADAVISNSEFARKACRISYGVDSVVIPEGIDTVEFVPLHDKVKSRVTRTNPTNLLRLERDGSYRLDYEDLNETFNILTVCRNQTRKNIPKIIEAVHGMRALIGDTTQGREPRLILHVPADARGWDLHKLIRDHKAWDWIYIHYQWTNDSMLTDKELNGIYNLADVYLNMSSAEGLSTAAFQAMATETPVVSNQLPIPQEWGEGVIHTVPFLDNELQPVTHIEWNTPDVEETADYLARLYQDRVTDVADMASKGRTVAREREWVNVKPMWFQLFEKLPKRGMPSLPQDDPNGKAQLL